MTGELEISAILPCFEEAAHLDPVVLDLAGTLAAAASAWEIVVVSSLAARDGTPGRVRALAAREPALRPVWQAASDPGYGRALALGIEAARHPWLLLTDADGQFDHAELPRLVARAAEADVVVGYRAPRRDPWPRRAAGRLYTTAVCRLLGLTEITDLDCAFKLVHQRFLGEAPLRSRTGAINAEILARARSRGARVAEVPVSHRPRLGGRTRFEMRLGFLPHLPHPFEVWRIARDVAALLSPGHRR